jgi:hypothetical protein
MLPDPIVLTPLTIDNKPHEISGCKVNIQDGKEYCHRRQRGSYRKKRVQHWRDSRFWTTPMVKSAAPEVRSLSSAADTYSPAIASAVSSSTSSMLSSVYALTSESSTESFGNDQSYADGYASSAMGSSTMEPIPLSEYSSTNHDLDFPWRNEVNDNMHGRSLRPIANVMKIQAPVYMDGVESMSPVLSSPTSTAFDGMMNDGDVALSDVIVDHDEEQLWWNLLEELERE